MRRLVLSNSLALFALAVPATAEAHLVNTRLGDFYNGALHPLTGFEFVLPWIALSILAAFQDKERGRWLLLVFPLGLLAGASASLVLPVLSIAPILSIVALACVGLLVAAAVRLPLPSFVALVGFVALLHGYETGREMASDTDRFLFIGGVTGVGYVAVALLTGIAVQFLKPNAGWRFIALRTGGSWIAAIGIMVLGFQLAGLVHAG
jgi:hydrogenase/urease accessory protein HupE